MIECVIPLHHQVDHAKLESWGSGVLLRADEWRILASAAHVLLDDPIWLPAKPEFVPLDLAGRVVTTAPDLASARVDRKDVGYVLLNPRTAEMLEAQGLQFLSMANTSCLRELPPADRYIVSGYPCSKSSTMVSRQQIWNARMDALGEAISDAELVELGCNPMLHIAVRYDREALDYEGKRVTGPLPKGMSGGAIWHVSSDNTLTLAGIVTDYEPGGKYIRGTRINPLLFRIRDHIRADLQREGRWPVSAA